MNMLTRLRAHLRDLDARLKIWLLQAGTRWAAKLAAARRKRFPESVD
jgi:hypothetical protein